MSPRPVGWWTRGFDSRALDQAWLRDGYRIEINKYDISRRFQTRFVVVVRGFGKRIESEFFVDDRDIDGAAYKADEVIDVLVETIENMRRPDNTQAVLDKLTEMARAVVA